MERVTFLPRPWIREQELPGDASSRRYARIWDGDDQTAILVRYPEPIRDQLDRDLEVQAWCASKGLRVPVLLDNDLENGWAVHEDFGIDDAERTLQKTPAGERSECGLRLIGPLVCLSQLLPSKLPMWNPPLDAARMRWELAGFEMWCLRHCLEVSPSPRSGRWLDDLCSRIEEHPRRVCHRDYHLNNLFLLANGDIGLIDYQDILIGPDTYDAVSLLGERGIPRLLSADHRTEIQGTWATATVARPGWEERWQWVRIQRGLKALGTFARLTRAGADSYNTWIDALVSELVPELVAVDAPSELVDHLLDLSRRRHRE